MNNTIMIQFAPAVACWHCDRRATYGVYEADERALRVGCPAHGYNWETDDQAAEQASIERFVVWAHGGLGRARVLERLPDIEYDDGSSDYVWQVEYRGDAPPVQLRVIWENQDLTFSWYN